MTEPYSLLVSSCDAYSDCWAPFFTLLARYWDGLDRPVYLNTETEAFSFPGIDIRCPRVGLASARGLTWSERLRRCLDMIPHEVVLYVQEDYLLKDTVDVAAIERLVEVMYRDRLTHISLHRDGRPGQKSSYPFLSHIDQRAEYRVSAQAGLWSPAGLRSYLRSHETIWEFEWYGTRRARRKHDTFFYVNEDYEVGTGRPMIFPYDGTGIVQGRWTRAIVEPLFKEHGISVDFAQRGFLEDHDGSILSRRPRIIRAARRLRSAI